MNVTRPTGRASTALREEVFDRDDYRCIDCGPRWLWLRAWFPPPRLPASLLEADHDTELADGGTNDLSNLVTRCLAHHDAKTQERRMARTQITRPDARTTTPRNPNARSTTARAERALLNAHVPPRPSGKNAARQTFALALLVGSLWGCAHMLGYVTTTQVAVAVASTSVTRMGIFAVMLFHWHRVAEAQRVYERLAGPAGVPTVARKERFKVKGWKGTTPNVVLLTYGPKFDPDDPQAVAALARAFAAAVHVPVAEVTVTLLKRGRARIGVAEDSQGARALRAQDEPTSAPAPVAVSPVAAGPVLERVQDALNAVIDTDQGRTTVPDWHPDGTPARVEYRYPARATAKIGDNLVRFRDTLDRLYPPTAGEWSLTWDSRGDLLVFADEPDLLAPEVPLQPVEREPDLYEGVTIGVTETGEPWRIPLMGGKHWLVAGASGAGKGSVLWGIVRALEFMVRMGLVRLWIIDPKGGSEFHEARPYTHRFAVAPEECTELLEEVRDVMQAKARAVAGKGRKIARPTREFPLDLVIVDEIANITAYVDSKTGAANAAALAALCSMGRSAGVTVVAAVQDPRKEVIKNRGLFTAAIALRLSEAGEVNLILGSGVRAKGATADLIPEAHPGIGYMISDGKAGYVRARAAFISDEETQALAQRITAQPPEHGGVRAGEQLVLPDAPAGGEPVPVGEVLASANVKPVKARDLEPGMRVTLPGDEDPVTIVSKDDDPEDPDMVEVVYRYDGETQEKVCSFDRTEHAFPA